MEQKAIYKITNLLNNKVYIGQSIHPNRRWIEHKQHAFNNLDNYPIHCALRKYRVENFSFEILEWTENYNIREQQLIKEYNSLIPNGYNIGEGGENYVMCGENHPRNITPNFVIPLIINDLKENKLIDREIAKKYNLTDKIVADINHGYSHKNEKETYPIRKRRGSQKLTIEHVNEIKYALETSLISYAELGQKYGVTKQSIASINYGKTFNEPNRKYPIRTKHKEN